MLAACMGLYVNKVPCFIPFTPNRAPLAQYHALLRFIKL